MPGAKKDAATLAVEAVADTAVADLRALLRTLDSAIARALAKMPTENGRVKPRNEMANLTVVRGQVLRALDEAGAKAIATLDRRTLQAAQRAVSLVDIPAEFRPDADAAIRDIVKGRTREIAAAFDGERSEVVAAINAGITSGAKLDSLIGAVAERAEVAFSRARALVDMGVISSGRAVITDAVAEANDAGMLFVLRYVGPLDGKTRPFCRPLVGDCFTESAVMSMDNGHGLPVREFCGGYGPCRHGWAPTTVENARERGWRVVGL